MDGFSSEASNRVQASCDLERRFSATASLCYGMPRLVLTQASKETIGLLSDFNPSGRNSIEATGTDRRLEG